MMQKVLVIGCGGSGKSTLARGIHEKTGLELISLDKEYWHAGWVETPPDKWKVKVKELITGENWVMDGNYGGTMDIRIKAADTIIFLDRPTNVLLWRTIKRSLTGLGKVRQDMPDGCPERLQWSFIQYVKNYNKTRRPAILKKLQKIENEKSVVILRNDQECSTFLRHFDH